MIWSAFTFLFLALKSVQRHPPPPPQLLLLLFRLPPPPARTCCVLAPEPFISFVSPLVWDDVIHSEDNRAHLPVSVSSHAHRSSEWHTLRRDASWVSQALLIPLICWFSCFILKPDRAEHLFLSNHVIASCFWTARRNEQALKVVGYTSGSYSTASGRATRASAVMETHPAARKWWIHLKTTSVDVSDASSQ